MLVEFNFSARMSKDIRRALKENLHGAPQLHEAHTLVDLCVLLRCSPMECFPWQGVWLQPSVHLQNS